MSDPKRALDQPSTIPEPVDADIVRRTKIAMRYFTDTVAEAKGNKAGMFMKMLTEEMLEESEMVPPEFLEFYMKQAAAILFWTATGERIINMPIPHDFAAVIPKELNNGESPKELPVGQDSELHNRIWHWIRRWKNWYRIPGNGI